jgi:hypothetical protein
MKHFLLSPLFLYLTFIYSCSTYQKGLYLKPQKTSFTSVPLQPHNLEVDVFTGNDKPSRPYYRVKLVEVTAAPGTSADGMLNRLKAEAQRQGIDAVLIDDIGRQLSNTTTLPSNDGIYTFQKLVALGLKYKERMQYVTGILKEQEVQLWKDSLNEPKTFSIRFDLSGSPLSFTDTFIQRFFNYEIYPFETHNTIYAPLDNWEYRIDTVTGIFSKRLVENISYVIKSDFTIYREKAFNGIITMQDVTVSVNPKYVLELEYNNNDVLVKRVLKNKKAKAVIWQDDISYYISGKPFKLERSIVQNGKMRPYFVIRNTYFSEADLPPAEN